MIKNLFKLMFARQTLVTSESLQTYQPERKHDTKLKESHSNEEFVR